MLIERRMNVIEHRVNMLTEHRMNIIEHTKKNHVSIKFEEKAAGW